MILKGPGLLNDRGHFCIRYQEALAIIEENKPVVLALAQGLDRSSRAHPRRRRDQRGDLADVGT